MSDPVLPSTVIITGATGAIGAAGLPAGSATIHAADPTESAPLDAAFAEIAATARPAGLVHAVGSTLLKPLHLLTDAEIDEVLRVNLLSAIRALRAFARNVPRGEPAAALLFSSAATQIGLVNHEAIATAKAGVDGLVRSAAATYATRGIRVNAIAPGLVRSGLTRRLVENEAVLRASEGMHPLGRIGEPEDVAALAALLVSPATAWVTGQTIGVDGGLAGIKLPPRG